MSIAGSKQGGVLGSGMGGRTVLGAIDLELESAKSQLQSRASRQCWLFLLGCSRHATTYECNGMVSGISKGSES